MSASGLVARTPLLRAGVAFADSLRPRARRPFQVLVYHRVNDDGARYFPGVPTRLFARQMELLARGWNVLPLDEVIERARSGDTPPRAAAITFDDGYRDNFEHAFPILRRLGLPATIFLATGPLDGGGPLWHDRVFAAFAGTRAASVTVDGVSHALDGAARDAALHAFLGSIRRGSGADLPGRVDALVRDLLGAEPEPPEYLRWEDARAMAEGGIQFGAHTVTHPILTRLPLEDAMREVRESRAAIERSLGRPVRLFAFPNGSPEDMSEELRSGLEAEGFLAALSTVWGTNDARTNPYSLRRVGLWDRDPEAAVLRLAWYRLGA